MKNILTAALFVCSIVLFSCAGNSEGKVSMSSAQISEQDALFQSMMDVHDEVMPKLSEMSKLAQEIRTLIPNDAVDDDTKEQAYQIVHDLGVAEENMFGWMQEIKQPAALRDTASHEFIMSYYTAEKSKIEGVAKSINSGIAASVNFLNNYKGAEK